METLAEIAQDTDSTDERLVVLDAYEAVRNAGGTYEAASKAARAALTAHREPARRAADKHN